MTATETEISFALWACVAWEGLYIRFTIMHNIPSKQWDYDE